MDYERIKNPPAEFRPVSFWSWNDYLSKEELIRQIEELRDKGWGGFFMHPRVGLLTRYDSEEWHEIINTCAEKAKEEGFFAWLYDEDRWPSGYGSGKVALTEEYRSRALVLLKESQITDNDTVFTTYEDQGITYSIAKRVSPLGDPWFNGTSFVDLMNPKAVECFLDNVHEHYKAHCGERFGHEVPGVFTDEPSYLMRNAYEMPALPWSEYLEDFFEARYGYSIREHLPELFFDIGDYQKTRYQFLDSASSLFLESFTKQYARWCEKNDLKLVGHLMAEDSLSYQTGWVGSVMPHYEYMSYPGIDKLGRRVNQNVTVKQAASVADQLGKERVLSEVFGCIGQQSGFVDQAWIANWEAVLGINFVAPHLTLYSMRGERKRDFPSNISYPQPWWEDEKVFADYLSRLSMLMTDGKRDVKILVIHTIASCWSVYTPMRNMSGECDVPFQELADQMLAENLDFHFGDESIMQRHASVKDGKLILGNCEYAAVVLPPAVTLKANTYDLLDEFVAQAGSDKLICIEPLPTRMDGEMTQRTLPERRTAVSIDAGIQLLLETFPEHIQTLDRASGANADRIYCAVRKMESGKAYLFVNTENTREVQTRIIIQEDQRPCVLDLATGEFHVLPCRTEQGKVIVDATFYPSGSLALFCPNGIIESKPEKKVLGTGVAFDSFTRMISKAREYRVELLAPNVLPVNRVTLELDGKKVADHAPLARVWKDHFYAAEAGTPFKADYEFEVSSVPAGDVFAVVECAHHLDRITLNGQEIRPLGTAGGQKKYDPEVNYLDINFNKIPLAGIQKGKNILSIEGAKFNNTNGAGGHRVIEDYQEYRYTELDAIYIIGEFAVDDIDRRAFRINGGSLSPQHQNLAATGCPFYVGRAVIKAKLDFDGSADGAMLHLNSANCCTAAVKVNGQMVGMNYLQPFLYDVSGFLKKGTNEIEVEIANTLFNLLGPNWIDGVENVTYVCPELFSDFTKYTETYTFMPFGIEGIEILKEDEEK